MRHLILIAILFSSILLNAQNKTDQIAINFKDATVGNENIYQSKIFTFNKTSKYSFAFISAFAEKENARMQLFYQVTIKGVKQKMENFQLDQEGITAGRSIFIAKSETRDFESIQFFSDMNTETQIHFRVFMPETNTHPKDLLLETRNSLNNCACPQPEICDRLCWCNDCPPDATPAYTSPTHIIVHHSAGHNESNDYAAVVTSYWDYHVNTKGWDDIGYNWLIDPNGVIYEGRGDGVRGAHFSCMNTYTTGICLVGNFEEAEPTTAALSALTSMIAWEACDKNIQPDTHSTHLASDLDLYHVSGHRDGNTSPFTCTATVCPGEALYIKLEEVRDNAAAFGCMTSINNMQSTNHFLVNPNPTNGSFVLANTTSTEKPENVMITNISGKIVRTIPAGELKDKTTISLESFPAGVYFIFIKTSSNIYKTKIVKF